MATNRNDRKEVICELVRQGGVRTQTELMDALNERGFAVTQGTVSRDLAALDLAKDEKGYYALPQDLKLKTIGKVAIVDVASALNQVIVHTEPGAASSVAAAIDGASNQEVLGSIAGDDTILVICSSEASAEDFKAFLNTLLNR